MSSRLDLPKVEIALGQTTAVDEYCRDKAVADGGIEEAVGVWVEIAAGWYANIVMPYGTIIDTNWLGKRLGPEFQGFMWSKKLGGICRNESDPDVAGPKYWTNRLNEKFKEMTPKVYMDDKEEDHMKEGEIMKEVKENGGNKEDKEKSLSSGDSTIVSSMGDSTAVSSTRDSTMTSSTTESSSSSGASTTASSTKV
ncbi:hypothetical protein T440DRAFT_464387 [Plenodomus tracheiphilus IPT5]|uniref:Uncharacterized protein n=1 Tax=Plenodomus tracheiphilus IPT5 TaxID=1408161 RepID=A0A6A7BLQ8_9PLEO|nr:hypothetical protein T440DRAFT_464387 [Plenodomus tracheiphilus IPT5]